MTLKFGNTTVHTTGTITYNGYNVKKVVYNGVTVWEKASGLSNVLEAAQTAILLHGNQYESNSGYAEITKSNYPTLPSTYRARAGFGSYLYLSAQQGTNNGTNWFNIGGLTTTATDKFTVECIVMPSMNNYDGSYTELVFGTGSNPDAIWRLQVKCKSSTTGTAKVYNGAGTVINYQGTEGGVSTSDGWYHLAATYHGNNTWSFFVNGTKLGTFSYTGVSTGYNFTFIHGVASGSDMGGFDEIVVHSYDRYTANFTVQTEPYTISN